MSEQEKYKKPYSEVTILGVNLAIFALYTILGVLGKEDALIASFFAAVIHFVICTIMAIVARRWVWFLAGVLILIIGFGTCVNTLKI
ncbi:hypothetical protein [Mucilaginibacter agri]|uniref:Uncharacterized protein n=1 Tax=Mucilaginibacter agri TaxID=2695265 RepID=A0A966DUN0_9SPHI|nr:hypothetical protein [Mucilaginibacter agri]NCD70597.1 hypothetical protein [Mucilaginibacter agri]